MNLDPPASPDDLHDNLAALTLATSYARAVLVSSKDVAHSKHYPFARIHGRADEARVLREWLLGGRDAYDPDRRPLGGAALVTGFRGVGKTTLVNKVLFDVSLAGLYGFPFADAPDWGPFDRARLEKAVKAAEGGAPPTGRRTPRLYVPVHVDVANAIERRDLMERVLRRTYFALSRYQIGALRPDLMRRARLAYIRTLGKLEASTTTKVNEKLTSTLGATLEGLSKMEVTAQQEMEFAETLKLIAEDLSIEEMEDELIDLGAELSDGVHGVIDPAGRRVLGAITEARYQGYMRLRQLFYGDVGRQVHLVFIFDELDKLDDGTAAAPETADLTFTMEPALVQTRLRPDEKTVGNVAFRRPRSSGTALATTAAVIKQLKILFSTSGLSAIVIGGAVAEEQWLDEVAQRDPLLRSVFTRHVYVPQLGLDAITSMFANHTMESDKTPAALAFWTRGRYKQLLRARGAMLAKRLDDEFPHAPHEALATLLGDFGGTVLKDAIKTPPSPTTGIASAPDLETLAAVLLVTASPITRREAFGADLLRTLLIRVAIEFLDPVLQVDTLPPERAEALRQRLGEMLPSSFIEPVMNRVRDLVRAALRGPARAR